MIRIGKTRNLLRASSSLLEIWTRSAHHHPGQRRHVSRTNRPDKSTHSITCPDVQKILANRAASTKEGWTSGPPPPPLALAKAFSRSGGGRIFPLFSRVMRAGLLTGLRPEMRARVLSGPIFSGPVNRRRSGEQLQVSVNKPLRARVVSCQFDMPAALRARPWSNLRWSVGPIMPPWRNHRLLLAAKHEHKRLPQVPSFRPA